MKEIISSLIKLADHLDKKGFSAEANQADLIISKIATEETPCEKCKEAACDGACEAGLAPTKQEPCCMAVDEKAEANLKKVQMRRRARRRLLMIKEN